MVNKYILTIVFPSSSILLKEFLHCCQFNRYVMPHIQLRKNVTLLRYENDKPTTYRKEWRVKDCYRNKIEVITIVVQIKTALPNVKYEIFDWDTLCFILTELAKNPLINYEVLL